MICGHCANESSQIQAVRLAVSENHWECLRVLLQGKETRGIDYEVIVDAITNKNEEILRLLVDHNYPMSTEAIEAAIDCDDPKFLKILLDQSVLPAMDDALSYAYSKKSMWAVHMAIDHGVQPSADVFEDAIVQEDMATVRRFLKNIGDDVDPYKAMDKASRSNSEILQLLVDQGFPLDSELAKNAIFARKLQNLAILIEDGCPLDDIDGLSVADVAAATGPEYLQMVLDAGAYFSDDTLLCAIKAGATECVKILLENGCNFEFDSDNIGSWAACMQKGNMEILEICYGMKKPGEEFILQAAFRLNSLAVSWQRRGYNGHLQKLKENLNGKIARECLWLLCRLFYFPLLEFYINELKAEKAEMEKICHEMLHSLMPADVIKHGIYSFI